MIIRKKNNNIFGERGKICQTMAYFDLYKLYHSFNKNYGGGAGILSSPKIAF